VVAEQRVADRAAKRGQVPSRAGRGNSLLIRSWRRGCRAVLDCDIAVPAQPRALAQYNKASTHSFLWRFERQKTELFYVTDGTLG
jgi:hypothetical protein